MEQPDFSKYSELQLRQVITRIDRERFPERLAEIERRLAALADKDEKTDARLEFSAGEFQLISSQAARFTHVILPYFWFGVWLIFAVIFLASKDKNMMTGLFLLVHFCFGLLLKVSTNQLRQQVYLGRDLLVTVRRDEKEVVCLTNITEVEVSDGETMTVVLHLSSPTKFGQRIEFVPATKIFSNPFKESAVVSELKARISAAQHRMNSLKD